MQTTLTQEEAPVVEALHELLSDQPFPDGEVDADALRATAAHLAEHGWLEPSVAGSDLAQPFWVLTMLAETAAEHNAPVAFPLIDTWIALQALALAGVDVEPYTEGARTLTLASEPLWGGTSPTTAGSVPAAALVDDILVPVPDAVGDLKLHVVAAADLTLTRGAILDDTLPTWSFGLSAAALGEPAGKLDAATAATTRAKLLTLESAEMVGAAESLLRRTVQYLGEREQFGRPLSNFQALQHRAANALMTVETARSLTYYAGWCCEAHPDASEPYGLMAKGFVGERCWEVANEAIQLHGGIGYTWERGLQYNTTRIALRSLSGLSAADCRIRSGLAAIERGDMLGMVE